MLNTISQLEANKGMKILAAILLAAFITFLLFVMMQELIAQDGNYAAPEPLAFTIDPVLKVEEKPTTIKTQIKPFQPPQAKPKPTQPSEPVDPNDGLPKISVVVSLTGPVIETIGQSKGATDMQSRPIVRVPPKYPNIAAQQGVEGWVELQFTIDASGAVKDVKVVDSQPKRVFDREATKALRKWKYKPQWVNGRPVDQPGQQVVLDFSLES